LITLLSIQESKESIFNQPNTEVSKIIKQID